MTDWTLETYADAPGTWNLETGNVLTYARWIDSPVAMRWVDNPTETWASGQKAPQPIDLWTREI